MLVFKQIYKAWEQFHKRQNLLNKIKKMFIREDKIVEWKKVIKGYSNKSLGNVMKNKLNNKLDN